MSADAPAIVAPPKPGLYKGVDFETYWSWEAVNSTILKGFASGTPAHVRYELDHGGRSPTKSLELGSLTHLAVLEPERFASEVAIPPKVDRRFKEGKARWADFEAENQGKQLVSAGDFAKATGMRDSLLVHPTASELLASKSPTELSLVWEDKEHGVLCKARIDKPGVIGACLVVGELKTTADASRRAFEKDIYKYGYGIAGAHYLAGLQALVPVPEGNPPRRLIFLAVESEPPYCVACYELDDITLEQAEMERQRYLRAWRLCNERNEWPAYGDGVETAGYPAWVFKSFSSEAGE
jgi:hypothetical protein